MHQNNSHTNIFLLRNLRWKMSIVCSTQQFQYRTRDLAQLLQHLNAVLFTAYYSALLFFCLFVLVLFFPLCLCQWDTYFWEKPLVMLISVENLISNSTCFPERECLNCMNHVNSSKFFPVLQPTHWPGYRGLIGWDVY